MSRDRWAPGTRAVHAGLPDPEPGAPFLPGPVFAGPFHLPGDPEAAEYGYGRIGNPTWTNYEAALGELEGGEAVAFASGMAAVTAVLYALGVMIRARPTEHTLDSGTSSSMVHELASRQEIGDGDPSGGSAERRHAVAGAQRLHRAVVPSVRGRR